jgi:hypothetical protein
MAANKSMRQVRTGVLDSLLGTYDGWDCQRSRELTRGLLI